MKLNVADLAVWFEVLKDQEMKDICNRILVLSTSKVETKELKDLLKIEKQSIMEAKKIVENNNQISAKIDEYINIINDEGDHILKTAFTNLILSEFMGGTIASVEEVDELYHKIRVDYLNIELNDQITKQFADAKEMSLADVIASNSKAVDDEVIVEHPVDFPKNNINNNFHSQIVSDSNIKPKIDFISSTPNGFTKDTLDFQEFMKLLGELPDLEEKSNKDLAPTDLMFETTLNPEQITKIVYENDINEDEWSNCEAKCVLDGLFKEDPKETITELMVYIKRFEKLLNIK